jgi:hypothetical protein
MEGLLKKVANMAAFFYLTGAKNRFCFAGQ